MRNTFAAISLAWVVASCALGAGLEEAIDAGYAAVRALQPMQARSVYLVPVGDASERGPGDQFLRRRTASEISASKLSCGCGDNAVVFLNAVEGRRLQVLFIDSAEVSSASLLTSFSGHAVVALREPGGDDATEWCLVDTTNLTIISKHWTKTEPSFRAFGHLFWVGYSGPLEKYPVHSPEELRRFYAATLAAIPRAVLSSMLIRLEFKIDPSLVEPDGSVANPRLPKFIELQNEIFSKHGINPTTTLSILLKRGGDDARADLVYTESEGWISHVGLKSACSPSSLDYYESTVRRELLKKEAASGRKSANKVEQGR